MKYAIIEIGGKQQMVEEGYYYVTDCLPQRIGTTIQINRILFCYDNGHRIIGHPYIENNDQNEQVTVFATILEHFNANKIDVFKMKPKKNMSKTQGYRHANSFIFIDKIEIN